MVLAVAGDLPLDDLAALADRVLEVAAPEISACHTTAKDSEATRDSLTGNPIAESKSLMEEVQWIGRALEALNNQRERGSRSTSRNRASTSPDTARTCWYHRRFGENARKCVAPCARQGNMPAAHSKRLVRQAQPHVAFHLLLLSQVFGHSESRLCYVVDKVSKTRFLVEQVPRSVKFRRRVRIAKATPHTICMP